MGFAVFLTLGLLLFWVYMGWQKERSLHYADDQGRREIIADLSLNLGGVPYREHCLTCHPQGRAGNLSGKSRSFKEHPDIAPHDLDELGCTACHLGEGMARDLKISHGALGNEGQRVLSGEELQASCYRCHELKPLKGAEKAWAGRQLFLANACPTCHNLEGLSSGVYGPDLSKVGSFLGIRQIEKAIEDPKADPENSIMPRFSLAPEEIKSLAYFLKSRMKDSFIETPMMKKLRLKKEAQTAKQKKEEIFIAAGDLLQEKRCLACHKFREEDGRVGPDLTFIAWMRKETYLRNFLKEPGKEIPGAIMPRIPLSPKEEKKILSLLTKKDQDKAFHGQGPKFLYMMLCQRCHAAQGNGLGIIQPNLANFPRPFWKNADFFKGISQERIRESIKKGIPGTSMPPYGELLGNEDIQALIDLIFREFIRLKITDKVSLPPLPAQPTHLLAAEKGEKVFQKHCASCHGVSGNGRGSTYWQYLPRPRDLTNAPYFQSLDDERIARAIFFGIPGTAMGPYSQKLSAAELWSLVKKIRDLSGTQERRGQ
ncbi:MAG: c-type cytochrome [Thermodesulfobacteriota bacterium]